MSALLNGIRDIWPSFASEAISTVSLPVTVQREQDSFTTVVIFHHGVCQNDIVLGKDWFAFQREIDLHTQQEFHITCPVVLRGPENHYVYDASKEPAFRMNDQLSVTKLRDKKNNYESRLCALLSTVKLTMDESVDQTYLASIAASHGIVDVGMDVGLVLREHIIKGVCAYQRGEACKVFAYGFSAIELQTNLAEIHRPSVAHVYNNAAAISITNESDPFLTLETMSSTLERLSRQQLNVLAASHGLHVHELVNKDEVLTYILQHLTEGSCLSNYTSSQCARTVENVRRRDSVEAGGDPFDLTLFKGEIIMRMLPHLSKRLTGRILDMCGLKYDRRDRFNQRRQLLKGYAKVLMKGKAAQAVSVDEANVTSTPCHRASTTAHFPNIVKKPYKDALIARFREATSSEALRETTCASCGELRPKSESAMVSLSDIDSSIFTRPDIPCVANPSLHCKTREPVRDWLDSEVVVPTMPTAHCDGIDGSLILEPAGLTFQEGEVMLNLCKVCYRGVSRRVLPSIALANMNMLGDVPQELKDLTPIEESMIARCRSKCWIVRLKEDNDLDHGNGRETDFLNSSNPMQQRAVKGNMIIFPQNPQKLLDVLPPPVQDVVTPICVLFIGSKPPSPEWLQQKAKPLIARKEKVQHALEWLKRHNSLYKDITISNENLSTIPDEGILPFHVEHVPSNDADDVLTSCYDRVGEQLGDCERSVADIPFESVVVTDVDGGDTPAALRQAAQRHVHDHPGGYIQLPHGVNPENEFNRPELFPLMYPTLFPYGLGGFEDHRRTVRLSMKAHVKHFMNLRDRRFQEHNSFMFSAFNILQRRAILFHSSRRTKRKNFKSAAVNHATVRPETILRVSERLTRGDARMFDAEEKRAFALMKEVDLINAYVPGSNSGRLAMRNEIRALINEKGLPSFFITINPADVYNPIVKFLAGDDIDIDNLLPEQVSNYHEQSILIAKNPAIAAKFFNIYMKAFIRCLLGHDGTLDNQCDGVFGVVKGYYGCVESQGRGSLHCHMIVWIDGSLDPNELADKLKDPNEKKFREELIQYLDENISNVVPPDPVPEEEYSSARPFKTRGVNVHELRNVDSIERGRDLHFLVEACQVHVHHNTCFKYCKPGALKECRFGLDVNNRKPVTVVDPDTGELTLRCLDGLVNNFNSTIIEAIRCNMDIKFIGSGTAAKAVLYYITDYISKSQLKANVAYAALESAIRKLDVVDDCDDEITIKAKTLLRKCAFSMIARQELSAQMVATYLMDYDDHFSSHEFARLYWPPIEKWIEMQLPSPECYNSLGSEHESKQAEVLQDDEDGLLVSEVDGICTTDHVDLTTATYENSLDAGDRDVPLFPDILDPNEMVRVSGTSDGQLLQHGSQLEDYMYRGEMLSDVSVWDFVAQVEKRKKPKSKGTHINGFATVDYSEDEWNECDLEGRGEAQSDTDMDMSNGYDSNPLDRIERARPKSRLQSQHTESNTHSLQVLHPSKRKVCIPIGPRLPRRDVPNLYSKYCRLMLILFKPWRNAADLKNESDSWQDAFERFVVSQSCQLYHKTIMKNMQLLHECKDSRDDHFAKRRERIDTLQKPGGVETRAYGGPDDVDIDQDDLLDHLQSIEDSRSLSKAEKKNNVDSCLLYMQQCGTLLPRGANEIYDDNDSSVALAVDRDNWVTEWHTEYERRRSAWKTQATSSTTVINAHNIRSTQASDDVLLLQDGTRLRNIVTEPLTDTANQPDTQIRQDIHPTHQAPLVDMNALIKKWGLVDNQELAFRIITEQSMTSNEKPLRMFICGPAGTGKTRVINAVKDFFTLRKQQRRFRLCAFMGISAKHISGMTLHTALSLTRHGSKKKHMRSDLVSMWEGIDFLFVDEVSMIGVNLLRQVSEALSLAKGNTNPFGNMNVIFAGDFAQLPPVGDSALYAGQRMLSKNSRLVDRQESMSGKLLWLSIDTVIMLTKVWRQDADSTFVDLLTRLREGRCTDCDYDRLCSRIITPSNPVFINSSSPIIVQGNALKDALNEHATMEYARQQRKSVHWYYAKDSHNGTPLTDITLKQKLRSLDSGETEYRLSKIPLVTGMPVVVGYNFDVDGGVVNGSRGLLREIRYEINDDGFRELVSCVVEVDDVTNVAMPHLAGNMIPILPDEKKMLFIHPHTRKKCSIVRKQLPIMPGFAFTAHKAQGLTMENVVVDLKDCKGTAMPYVMISRVKSLDGLHILRPFEKKRITVPASEDYRREKLRCEILYQKTLIKHGKPEDKRKAEVKLNEIGAKPLAILVGQADARVAHEQRSHTHHLDPPTSSRPSKKIRLFK